MEACRHAHINRDTFYQWMRDESFRQAYETHSRELIQDAVENLKRLANEAVEVMAALLRSRNPAIKFKSASAILDHVLQRQAYEQLEKEVEELKKAVNEGLI